MLHAYLARSSPVPHRAVHTAIVLPTVSRMPTTASPLPRREVFPACAVAPLDLSHWLFSIMHAHIDRCVPSCSSIACYAREDDPIDGCDEL
jgi:hypothetical protein